MPFSKARYSAAVSAILGVIRRSTTGSFAKVQEHSNVVRYTALLKGSAEELCYVIFNTHSCKYNGKVLIRICTQRSLLYDLCSQLIVRKTISGKDRKLLSSNQGGQSVDCGNTGVDIVSWIFTCYRVQRQTIDV